MDLYCGFSYNAFIFVKSKINQFNGKHNTRDGKQKPSSQQLKKPKPKTIEPGGCEDLVSCPHGFYQSTLEVRNVITNFTNLKDKSLSLLKKYTGIIDNSPLRKCLPSKLKSKENLLRGPKVEKVNYSVVPVMSPQSPSVSKIDISQTFKFRSSSLSRSSSFSRSGSDVGYSEWSEASLSRKTSRSYSFDEEDMEAKPVVPDLLDYECEFFEYLAKLGVCRYDFVHCLLQVVLPNTHHPNVEQIVNKWYEYKTLDVVSGKRILFLTCGKAAQYEIERLCDNLEDVMYEHIQLQMGIKKRIAELNLTYDQYDRLETSIFEFCENRNAARNSSQLQYHMTDVLSEMGIKFNKLEKLFGPARLLVQVGPHECLMEVVNGKVDPNDEFHGALNSAKYPTEGQHLAKAHFGPVLKISKGFNRATIVKVVSKDLWKNAKEGRDKFNDNVPREIDAHRFLNEFLQPNIVRFEGVTRDAFNVYYYQERGVELFNMVEKHRESFWLHWRQILLTKEKGYFASNGSPWEQRAQAIFKGVFQAVGFMHSIGLTHRDLKLENMVCVNENGQLVGKLIDFGVTHRYGIWEKNDFQAKGMIGTYPYYSPEMFYNGREEAAVSTGLKLANYKTYDDSKNDVFTLAHALCSFMLGVTLYADIKRKDQRFVIATGARYLENPEQWTKIKGLRALTRAYGKQRNEMISNSLIDLIERLFAPEPQRPSIAECLNHPWFQENQDSDPISVPRQINRSESEIDDPITTV